MNSDSVTKILKQWDKNGPGVPVDSLGIAVRIDRLAAILADRANKALEPLNLAMWEYDVLSTLRRQEPTKALTAGDIATETGMSSGAITHRLDRLAARQWVERFRDPSDRRCVRVGLTREGEAIVEAALATRVATADDATSPLGTRDRKKLDDLLRKLLVDAELGK